MYVCGIQKCCRFSRFLDNLVWRQTISVQGTLVLPLFFDKPTTQNLARFSSFGGHSSVNWGFGILSWLILVFYWPLYIISVILHAGYGDEKPAIVKKKRRRKKKGKKHKPFKVKDFKKLKKFMLPLLLAYKLKFFTLVPLMLAGLVLIVATTGFAGFFFALFAVGLGLKGHHWRFSEQMVFIIIIRYTKQQALCNY